MPGPASIALLDALILAAAQGRVARLPPADARVALPKSSRAAPRAPRHAAARMAAAPKPAMPSPSPGPIELDVPMFDIGANLLDGMFDGVYNGKQVHEPDLPSVLARAAAVGVRDLIVTAGSLAESRRALALVRALRGSSPVRLSCTVGVHPTRCNELEQPAADGTPPTSIAQLLEVAHDGMADGSCVAVGEIGLDFDRLRFCAREVQQRGFEVQLQLAETTGLPLFLHNRNTSGAFARTMREHMGKAKAGGVVHSFDGGEEELEQLLELGLSIGINGCSMRTDDNLRVAASVPLDRLLLETDAPWCQIRPTHAGHAHISTRFGEVKKETWSAESCVKARNEPCHCRQVLEVLAAARKQSPRELGATAYANARRLFYRG
jgi:TatD DNase family protein